MQGINSRFPTRETSVPRLGDGVVLLDVMCLHLRWNFTRVSVWILPLILKHDGPLLCLGIRSFRK